MFRVANSALKHGISIEAISHAYDLCRFEGPIEGDNDQSKILTIGPDGAGNLLELVGGPQPNGDYLVWHAMKCRPKYYELLPEAGS